MDEEGRDEDYPILPTAGDDEDEDQWETLSTVSSDDSDAESDADPDLVWESASEGDHADEADAAAEDIIPDDVPNTCRRPPVITVFTEGEDPRKAGLSYPVLTVVDANGVHELPVHYCTCSRIPISNEHQLLDAGLFPGTFKRIQTVFTFRVLDDFRMDNLESKTTPYHYYNKLRRLTNPAIPSNVKVSAFHLIHSKLFQLGCTEPISGVYEGLATVAKPETAQVGRSRPQSTRTQRWGDGNVLPELSAAQYQFAR